MLKASLNTQSMSFSKSGIVLKEGSFKFRHSAAWKQILSTDPNVNINTNFSGTVGDLSNNKIPFTNLLAGGSDATLTKDHRGIYTVSVIWTLGQENFTVSIERTGDAVIADYPSELWLRGDGVTGDDSGWEAVNSIKFKAVPDVQIGRAHV